MGVHKKDQGSLFLLPSPAVYWTCLERRLLWSRMERRRVEGKEGRGREGEQAGLPVLTPSGGALPPLVWIEDPHSPFLSPLYIGPV